jgi:sugar/nucleoside kinase (ribokinase family)
MDDEGGWAAVLAAARRAGMHTNLELVSLEPERMRQVARPCLPHLDSLIVNEVEAASVAGTDVASTTADGATDWSAMEHAAWRVLDLGVKSFVAVHFPAGCVAVTHDGGVYRQGSVNLTADRVVSAVGAGDAFASGVIHGVHEGWPMEDSLRAGVCVAAACLGGSGTSDGIMPLPECLALGAEFGFRSDGV